MIIFTLRISFKLKRSDFPFQLLLFYIYLEEKSSSVSWSKNYIERLKLFICTMYNALLPSKACTSGFFHLDGWVDSYIYLDQSKVQAKYLLDIPKRMEKFYLRVSIVSHTKKSLLLNQSCRQLLVLVLASTKLTSKTGFMSK